MPVIDAVAAALDAAVESGRTPGVVACVGDRAGVIHESAHGLRAAGGDQPMSADSVFRIYSMTKAIGTAAAMKLAEEGSLDLDAPVESLLPDFAEVRVLEGFDGEVPVTRAPRTVCTVRMLAAHRAGFAYDIWDERMSRYMKLTGGQPALSGQLSALRAYPMLFDPGTGWAYGTSIDWLGLVVEEAAGERIDAFLKREILNPLGMESTDVAFSPDMASRRVAAHVNGADGFETIDAELPTTPEFYGMGHALNGTGPDYLRFCLMILRGGELDGARVLAPETVAAMSEDALDGERLRMPASVKPWLGCDLDILPGVPVTQTLGFLRNEADVPGRRRAGSLAWGGVMNTLYWIDPTAGVAGVVMMQHRPFADADALAVLADVERAVYASL